MIVSYSQRIPFLVFYFNSYLSSKGLLCNNGVEATHLFSPPLYLFNLPSVEEEITSQTNYSLKISVSSDDSSIRIKKGEDKDILYTIEWTST